MEKAVVADVDFFTTYRPQNFSNVNGVLPHPGEIVEALSLADVKSPVLSYQLKLLQQKTELIENGILSDVQLECIGLACQKHEEFLPSKERAGFFLGDSTGVGKGRTIVGVITENFLLGRKTSIWITQNSDLFMACERDFEHLGNFVRTVKWCANMTEIPKFQNKCLLVAYSTLCCKKFGRLQQLIDSVKNDFNGVIAFDECQKAEGFKISSLLLTLKQKRNKSDSIRIGNVVSQLQKSLPDCRVIYSSATAISNPSQFLYMSRLGLWGEQHFPDSKAFIDELESRGLPSMEALAMHLKAKGSYMARHLSTVGIKHKTLPAHGSGTFLQMYDDSVDFFQQFYKTMWEFEDLGAKSYGNFWAAHQLFFSNLILSSKVDVAVAYAMEAERIGKSVIFGLQKTGEARLSHMLKDSHSPNSFSAASEIVKNMFDKVFGCKISTKMVCKSTHPTPQTCKKLRVAESSSGDDSDSSTNSLVYLSDDSTSDSESDDDIKVERVVEMKLVLHGTVKPEVELLFKKFDSLCSVLPPNPLDILIEKLGGVDCVAEMTGRKFRLATESKKQSRKKNESDVSEEDSDSSETNESQPVASTSKKWVVNERKHHTTDRNTTHEELLIFQKDVKHFGIMSDAASTGVSLHADPSFLPKGIKPRQRVYVTLEVPWSADKFLQQLGRTHRSGQSSYPEHVFIMSCVPGEDRFIQTVQSRLASMNALTQGDRKATRNSPLDSKLCEAKIGNMAIKTMFRYLSDVTLVPERFVFIKNFFPKMKQALINVGIGRMDDNVFHLKKDVSFEIFFNRILGMRMRVQDTFVKFFKGIVNMTIVDLIERKRFDEGIRSLKFPDECTILFDNTVSIPEKNPELTVCHLSVDFGLSWDAIHTIMRKRSNEVPKFFKRAGKWNDQVYYIYTENGEMFGYSPNDISKVSISENDLKNLKQIPTVEAIPMWEKQYKEMDTIDCIHVFLGEKCPENSPIFHNIECCKVGSRIRNLHVVVGHLNAAWRVLETYVSDDSPNVVRLQFNNAPPLVGVVVEGNECSGEMLEIDLENIFSDD